jgi:hypothetical protein
VSWQADFAQALLSPDPAARPAWLAPAQAQRFAVYRNNVFHGLTEALGDAYPVVRRLLGAARFRAMAGAFIATSPPTGRSLALYGERFPAFIENVAPARSTPYLADVARLERAWLESLHAADARPLDPAALTLPGARLATARFVAHPATRLVASSHPIVAIWRANQDDVPAGPVDIDDRAETALVCRASDAVTVRRLDVPAAAFAAALLAGASAADAVGAGLDVADTFRCLIADGAFTALRDT